MYLSGDLSTWFSLHIALMRDQRQQKLASFVRSRLTCEAWVVQEFLCTKSRELLPSSDSQHLLYYRILCQLAGQPHLFIYFYKKRSYSSTYRMIWNSSVLESKSNHFYCRRRCLHALQCLSSFLMILTDFFQKSKGCLNTVLKQWNDLPWLWHRWPLEWKWWCKMYWSRGSFSRGCCVAYLNNNVYWDTIAPRVWNRDVKVVCFAHL